MDDDLPAMTPDQIKAAAEDMATEAYDDGYVLLGDLAEAMRSRRAELLGEVAA